jgi:hypothetical protein
MTRSMISAGMHSALDILMFWRVNEIQWLKGAGAKSGAGMTVLYFSDQMCSGFERDMDVRM